MNFGLPEPNALEPLTTPGRVIRLTSEMNIIVREPDDTLRADVQILRAEIEKLLREFRNDKEDWRTVACWVARAEVLN